MSAILLLAALLVGVPAAQAQVVDTQPPPVVTDVVADVLSQPDGSFRVALAWPASIDDVGIHSYDVFRDGAWVGWSTGTSWTDTGPVAGATHDYRVRAIDTSFNWAGLSPSLLVFVGSDVDTQPPPVVVGVSATLTEAGGAFTVELSWPASIDNVGIHSYDVFRDGAWVGWSTGTSWTDTGRVAGATHDYRVRAIDTSFNLANLSTPLTVVISGGPDTQPPSVVTDVQAIIAKPNVAFEVALSWLPSADNVGIHSYDIFRDGSWVGWATGTSWTDTNVEVNGTYSYRVRAIDTSFNWTELSAPTTVTVVQSGPERFVTSWPHTFADAATGEPVYLNGVNVTARVFNDFLDVNRADLQRIADNGFNMIRLQLNWPDFQPGPGQFNTTALDDLERLVADADAVGLHVLLDPLHSTGPGYNAPNWFNVPAWVWAQAPALTTEQQAEDAMLDRLHQWASPYLVEMATRFANQPAVVAIDLISEARAYPPIAANPADSAQNRLLALYNQVIIDVRGVDADKILMIEPVYGNSDLIQADFGLLSDLSNVAITIHYYYAGGHPTGFDSAGTGNVGFHTWDGLVGYPVDDGNGNGGFPRAQLQAELANHLQQHLDLLEPWGIPLHIGEYAINPDASYSYEWIDDITTVFDTILDPLDPGRPANEVRMSRTWWRWTSDGGFELYNAQDGVTTWVVDLITRAG